MKEEWKDIKGYEGLYQVSNFGNVKRLHRQKLTSNDRILNYGEMTLKPTVNSTGYHRVILIDRSGKRRRLFVHRLVANEFCEKQANCNTVNHKDCNPLNNAADNLEWVTQSDNIKHAIKNNRMNFSSEWLAYQDGARKRKAVIGTNIRTGAKRCYDSVTAAKMDGFSDSNIVSCCKGVRKSHKGYFWNYAEGVV